MVSDGANNRSDPGQRRSISAAHARCNAPVASISITGGPSTPDRSIVRANSSTPSHNTGNVTGSPINPSLAGSQPHTVKRLARINRNRFKEASLDQRHKEKDAPRPHQKGRSQTGLCGSIS